MLAEYAECINLATDGSNALYYAVLAICYWEHILQHDLLIPMSF